MMMDKFKTALAKKVRGLRKNLGFSQEEIAKKMNLHRPTISQIESGEREISAEELVKLAMIFGVTIDELTTAITEEDQKPEPKQEGDKVITFFRHGEAIDDIYDQYGGWADPEMSPKGVSKAYQIATNLCRQGEKYQIIFCSPLKRARIFAEIMGREMKAEVKVMQYLKERNTYGLLSGINKTVAKKRFPELVTDYEQGKYVLGSERKDDFESRIPLIFEYLKRQDVKNIGCITHGKVLAAVIGQMLKMKPKSLEEGAMLKVGMDDKSNYYIQSEGIAFDK
jgi:broad specificity phosphatase PhoE